MELSSYAIAGPSTTLPAQSIFYIPVIVVLIII